MSKKRCLYNFKCGVCGEYNQSKMPKYCSGCRAEFIYDGDSTVPTQTIPYTETIIPDSDLTASEESAEVEEENIVKTNKKRFPWGWLFAVLIIVILGIVLVTPVLDYIKSQTAANQAAIQRFAQPVNDQSQQQIRDLELKLAQTEGQSAALAQQNQTLTQQNQDLAIAAQQAEAQAAALVQQNQIAAAVQQPVQATVITYPTEPIIWANYNGQMTNFGIFLDTELGRRITYTNRNLLVPDKAWNDPLTQAELRRVETTWVDVAIDLPEGMSATIFGHDFQQGNVVLGKGVFINLTQPGHYEFRLKNGEVIIWYPGQEQHKANDWQRIRTEVENGNFDIKHSLDLTTIR